MTARRDEILGKVRSSLGRGRLDGAALAAVESRLEAHRPGLVPQRGQGTAGERVDLFIRMAEEVATKVDRVASLEDLPDRVARLLAAENLPAAVTVAPHPALDSVPWDRRPTLTVRHGVPAPSDLVGLAAAHAAVAETGTLVLLSGADGPTSLNFLPETHMVLLRASDVAGAFEEVWARLRRRQDGMPLPRTVNLITGPSRSADIEQTIQRGAHGPRRLFVLLLDDLAPDEAGDG